jgi:multidrug efflux pump subunit AcrA (membrane-fusion protein)
MKNTFSLVSTLLVIVALAGCGPEHPAATSAPELVSDVAVQQVSPATLPDNVEAVGTVKAAESAQLAAQMMGTILSVNVHEGDRVRRGQVLVVIDAAQAQAGLDRARAAVSGAEHQAATAEADYALASQLLKQLAAVGMAIIWSAAGSALCFGIVKLVMPLRHARDAEREGLDIADHGERAYNY